MYDPLALDRQRIDQDRIRRTSEHRARTGSGRSTPAPKDPRRHHSVLRLTLPLLRPRPACDC